MHTGSAGMHVVCARKAVPSGTASASLHKVLSELLYRRQIKKQFLLFKLRLRGNICTVLLRSCVL